MPASSSQITELLKFVKDRNIELSQDEVDLIKTAPADSDLVKWLNNLDFSQLPTDEEIQIWRYIQDTGITFSKASSRHGEILTDDHLRHAISSLESSTRRTEARTEAISTQQALLSRHTKLRQRQQAETSSHVLPLQKKSAADSQHIHFTNEAKLLDLKARLQIKLDVLDKTSKSAPSILTERLNADDRLLESLQSSANETVTQTINPASEIARIDLLSKALERAKADTLKDRLDRVFLENLHYDLPSDDEQPEQTADPANPISHLQQDINSLYTEIDDVATMLVEHEHRARLRSCLEDIEKTQNDLRNQALAKTFDTITTMTSNLETLTAQLRANRSERQVLLRMLGHLDGIEKAMVPKIPPTRSNNSPIHRKGQNEALAKMLERLGIDGDFGEETKRQGSGSGDVEDGDPTSSKHASFVQSLEIAAQRRREAVEKLVDAAKAGSDLEGGFEMLKEQIARARGALEEATR